VTRRSRGGPGQFDIRLGRVEQLLAASDAAREPLATLLDVLHHQRRRASATEVVAAAARVTSAATARRASNRFPLLDLDASAPLLGDEIALAVHESEPRPMPAALREAGEALRSMPADQRADLAASWLEDPDLIEPGIGFWCRVAAGAPLELAAAELGPPSAHEWHGSSCPLCGSAPQVSVIAEESGEFMGGSPRSLVCARCATWWAFPRITCPLCGEDDPRHLTPFVRTDDRTVRIDCCATCHGYVKTFDLRQAGAHEVVPLVDDVATMALDLWANQRGFDRATFSFAGV
jgi:formate dehydrogenase accessory protein FdhE